MGILSSGHVSVAIIALLISLGTAVAQDSKPNQENPSSTKPSTANGDQDEKSTVPGKRADESPADEGPDTQATKKNKVIPAKSKTDKANQDKKKLSISEQRIAALKKQFEAEKENRPDRPEFNQRTIDLNVKGPIPLTFDDIKFDMKIGAKFKRDYLTNQINKLDGRTIQLKGYIKPSGRRKDLGRFVFVRDDKECCFGPGAALYDCVLVTMDKEHKTDFTVRPITIEGKFYLKEYKGPNGKVWAIYRMKGGIKK